MCGSLRDENMRCGKTHQEHSIANICAFAKKRKEFVVDDKKRLTDRCDPRLRLAHLQSLVTKCAFMWRSGSIGLNKGR